MKKKYKRRNSNSATFIIKINTTNGAKIKAKRDISDTVCYNYNKMSYISQNHIELPKKCV